MNVKKLFSVLFFLLCIPTFVFATEGTVNNQAMICRVENTTIPLINKAARLLAAKVVKVISPNTGHGQEYEVKFATLDIDHSENSVSCTVDIEWKARKTRFSSIERDCHLSGTMFLINDDEVYFKPKSYNDEVIVCQYDGYWQTHFNLFSFRL